MADDEERAQALHLAEIERVNTPRVVTPGLAACEQCGAAISAHRQSLGARRCLADQRLLEAEQQRRRKGWM